MENTDVEKEMTMAEAVQRIEELKDSKGNKNKPSEEEIKAAEKEFNEALESFTNNTYTIGTDANAKKIYAFLQTFIQKYVFWTKNGWMGVVKFNEELNAKVAEYKAGDLVTFGYQALEFLNYILSNPGGYGLQSAKNIVKYAEIYSAVLDETGLKLKTAREELKDLQFLQDKVASMNQGFYLEREDGVEQPSQDECMECNDDQDKTDNQSV